MSRVMRVALVALTALASACAVNVDGPPEIQVDRTACDHCTMLVSEARYAAAYQVEGAEARVFDDIGCLLDALAKEESTVRRVWFMDAADAKWIEDGAAVFVRSDEIRTPMSGGFIAYRDLRTAEDAAAKHSGSVIRSLEALRTAGRK